MRLFVALDLPESIRTTLADLIATLKSYCHNARWVRPEAMHVTLKFIGETKPEQLPLIISALSTIHSDSPVEMTLRGVGFFPNERRPRVAWCGIDASPNLARLADDISKALYTFGGPGESRLYAPHLTLARFSSPDDLERLISAINGAGDLKSRELGQARETEFHLYQSVLKPSGAEYTRLGTYPFLKELP